MGTETVVQQIAKALEDEAQLDAISLDFKRDFDVVPTERLLLRPDHTGIFSFSRHF